MLAQMLTLVPKVCPPTTADAHHEMVSIRAFWSMPAESLSTSSTVRRLPFLLASPAAVAKACRRQHRLFIEVQHYMQDARGSGFRGVTCLLPSDR